MVNNYVTPKVQKKFTGNTCWSESSFRCYHGLALDDDIFSTSFRKAKNNFANLSNAVLIGPKKIVFYQKRFSSGGYVVFLVWIFFAIKYKYGTEKGVLKNIIFFVCFFIFFGGCGFEIKEQFPHVGIPLPSWVPCNSLRSRNHIRFFVVHSQTEQNCLKCEMNLFFITTKNRDALQTLTSHRSWSQAPLATQDAGCNRHKISPS